MNDHVTISTFQLFQMFPDEETARLQIESRLWPNSHADSMTNPPRVGAKNKEGEMNKQEIRARLASFGLVEADYYPLYGEGVKAICQVNKAESFAVQVREEVADLLTELSRLEWQALKLRIALDRAMQD